MNKIVRWEDPPESVQAHRTPRRVEPSPWTGVAEELRSRPGEWAVIYQGEQGQASSIAQSVKQGAGRGDSFAPRGDFDALTRSRNGVACTYARFIGEPSPEVQR